MKKGNGQLRVEKQTVIFEAALKVFRQKGFHKARIADIAAQAGISYGLVYHYYNNKEGLFNAILHLWWEDLYRLMEKTQQSGVNLYQRLRKIILYFLDTYQDNPDLIHIFINEISRSSINLKPRLDYFKKFMVITEGIMADGQKAGSLRQDIEAHYLTYIFLGAMETFISVMVYGDQKIKNDQQKERITTSLLEVFLHGAQKSGQEGAKLQS
jgi:TetR/AcrR family transcriptional regulator, fatty acid metabolism regulator protein